MKIFSRILMIVCVLAVVAGASSCVESYVGRGRVEPEVWERHQFERQVRSSVIKAVNSPGVSSNSVIVVTTDGDTILQPADTTYGQSPTRVIYVDIKPEYPYNVSGKSAAMMMAVTIVGIVALLILLVLMGVFVTVWRRQSARTKVVKHAIDRDYKLPEAYFTGSPSQRPVSITQVTREQAACEGHTAPQATDDDGDKAAFEATTASGRHQADMLTRMLGGAALPDSLRQVRGGAILIGIGLVFFIAFASGGNAEVGFFVGGILFVLGLAKFLTVYLSRRI